MQEKPHELDRKSTVLFVKKLVFYHIVRTVEEIFRPNGVSHYYAALKNGVL